jgi:hypothetical protein
LFGNLNSSVYIVIKIFIETISLLKFKNKGEQNAAFSPLAEYCELPACLPVPQPLSARQETKISS